MSPKHDRPKLLPRMTPTFRQLLTSILALALWTPLSTNARPWKDAKGRTIEAELVSFDGTTATLKVVSGNVVLVPANSLCAEDQAFLKSQGKASPKNPVIAVESRKWPDTVEVPSAEIDKLLLVSGDAAARKFVYRSTSFEFTSQAKLLPSLMKEVARTFEATKRLVTALPWGIDCHPPDGMERYLAALYESRADYVAAGGPENSGGVYMTKDKTFRIPFQSLGIKKLGQSYTRDDNYSNDTLVHEITHQMMHDYLLYLPKWVIEGSAEFTEMMPYKSGTFRVGSHAKGVKEYLAFMQTQRVSPKLPRLADLFRMTRTEWDRQSTATTGAGGRGSSSRMRELYEQSALLVYYFNFLDGDAPKTGQRWMRFIDAVHGETVAWVEYEKGFADYRAKMEEFFKLPGVTKTDDGRFRYPSNLTPPKPPTSPEGEGKTYSEQTPLKHLGLLLDDRSEADIEREMVEKFAKMGLKLGF
jgi:hypothetical protein